MFLYINVISSELKDNKYWKEFNDIFIQQSPNWRPGQTYFGKDKYSKNRYACFLIYIALLYREFLINVVKERKWEKFWLPLSKKYLDWKKKNGRFENTWMNTGKLINSISISWDASRKRIRIGIDGRLKVDGIQLLQIAKWMEYGTAREDGKLPGCPARPLWRRVRDYISKNISRYYKDFEDLLENID